MSKANPYSHYSDFDQAWLGKLPSHWQVMRTKLLFDLVTEFAPVGNSEELLSVYTAIGVKPRKELEARGNKASSTDNYWRVQKGDIIVNKLLAWMGAIGISEYYGVTSPAYDILRPKENVNPYYYNFLFRNPIASREFKRHSRGIMDMRLRLYFTRFGDIKLPLPPMEEQDKIVEYLQFKLKKIDRFIRKKKQLIKLLNEQKAAIINNAVTKGLNPKAKTKPSGIEWLGDIPEHWEIKRLKYSTEVIRGKFTPRPRNDPRYYDGDYPFIQTGNITSTGKYIDNYSQTLNEFGLAVSREFPIGTIVMSIAANIADVAILNFNACFPDSVIGFKPNVGIISDFLFYQLKNLRQEFFKIAIKSTQYNLNVDRVKNIQLFIPPISEQEEIVGEIENHFSKIHQTISTIEKEIALTQEYRTALIAEAVTGKIDVRDFVIPEEKEVETYEDLEEELNIAAEDEAEYEIMEGN